jgi:AraC-like DNA-binding protein/ActR/RegA family two-component response regulator
MTARSSRASQGPTFDLVQAAQRFLVDVLPLRDPETRDALWQFCQALPSYGLARVSAEAIVITVLRKLGARCGVGAETLVNGYFLLDESLLLPDRFRFCIENLLRSRGISHPAVAAALELLDARCDDPHVRLEPIARELQISPSHLAHLISTHTGERFRAHLRQARMRNAARALLASANIQEVAAAVGYLHVSDFNHHFKQQFGVTPTVFRGRLVASGQFERSRTLHPVDGKKPMAKASIGNTWSPLVMVIEDDPVTCYTFGLILNSGGYLVEALTTIESARNAVQRRQPDAVVLDRWVGATDTLALACELGRTSLAGRVAVVTGDFSIEPETLAELTANGVRLVFKPLDLEDLVALVRTLTSASGSGAA